MLDIVYPYHGFTTVGGVRCAGLACLPFLLQLHACSNLPGDHGQGHDHLIRPIHTVPYTATPDFYISFMSINLFVK